MEGRWNELITPATRRADPDLNVAGAELGAALRASTHD